MNKYPVIPALALAACTSNGDKKADTSDTTASTPAANEPTQNKEYYFLLPLPVTRSMAYGLLCRKVW